jgi:drug/metabolite transporter (DMT)-like permease
MNGSNVIVLSAVFIISGVAQPLLVEVLTYNGAFDKSTLLFVLPNYIGMSMAILTDMSKLTNLVNIAWKNIFSLSVIDMASQGMCMLGLVYAGSSLYIVVYSGTTIWAAIFSRFILCSPLLWQQWIGVMIVVIGLSITALDSSGPSAAKEAVEVRVGTCLILVGSIMHALTWVLIEKWTKFAADRIAPEVMCSLMGTIGAFVYLLWQVVYTLPNYQTLVIDVIAAHNGRVSVIVTTYVALTFVSFLHALTFYWLLGKVGCVDAGVMKGCQSVAVFIISHFAFCSIQASQCLTTHKAMALVIVVTGVVIYSRFSSYSSSSSKVMYTGIAPLGRDDEVDEVEMGLDGSCEESVKYGSTASFTIGSNSIQKEGAKLLTLGSVFMKKMY